MNAADKEQRKRRWYQLNLRTLLILMIVIGVCLGWIGSEWRKKRQRTAVKVSGIVSLNGAPLDGAIVTFFNRDIASSGRTDGNGKFTLYIRSGQRNVTISKMKPAIWESIDDNDPMSLMNVEPPKGTDPSEFEPTELIPSRYSSPEESDLNFNVTFDGPNDASFHLVDNRGASEMRRTVNNRVAVAERLREAVRTSNVDRVRELLESGADANTAFENRFTPIYFAEDPRVVDLLLAHGAKLDIPDAVPSPIESAAEKWYRDVKRRSNWTLIVTTLRNAGAEYTIRTATYMNDVAFVRAALENDDSWVNKSRGGYSAPLRLAASTGRVEICKLLLDHKADPNSYEGGFPIVVDAVDHPAIVKLLIENGANLKRRITFVGMSTGISIIGDEASALHYAVRAGNLESVKTLVNAGLDPNAADDAGQTPLQIALQFERWHSRERDTSPFVKIIQYLLNNDASLQLTTKSGQTPLELAKELKSPKEIIQILQKKQKEVDQKIYGGGFHNR